MSEKQDVRFRHGWIRGLSAVFVLLLLLQPFLLLTVIERSCLEQEAALIGRVHERLPEQEAGIIALIYDTDGTQEKVEAGKETILKYGYTEYGFSVLKKRLRPRGAVLFVSAAGILSAAVFLLILFDFRRRFKAEKEALLSEIGRLRKACGELASLRLQNGRLKDFTENIAHQIKTPLARVLTSLEVLSDDVPETVQSRIAECTAHLTEIRQLIRRMLEIGRMEAGEVLFRAESFSLKALSEELLSDLPEESRPVLQTQPEEGSFIFDGSEEWIREALANLFDNLSKYGESTGDSSEKAVLSIEELPDEYRLTLRDHGPGFSEADLPYLFDRFYRTEEMKKGHVGLGMNLVRLIVEGHKGRVTAGNHPDGGAVLTVLLPRYRTLG